MDFQSRVRDQEEKIDLLNTNSRYIITVNDSIRANALTTMLPNDMSTYAETLEPGQTQELVLLLEVNEDGSKSEALVI